MVPKKFAKNFAAKKVIIVHHFTYLNFFINNMIGQLFIQSKISKVPWEIVFRLFYFKIE